MNTLDGINLIFRFQSMNLIMKKENMFLHRGAVAKILLKGSYRHIRKDLTFQIIGTHNVRHTDGWTNKRNYHDNKIVGE